MKKIDPNYIMDEVSLIGDIVLGALDRVSLRLQSPHFLGLVDELRERKMLRESTRYRSYGAPAGEVTLRNIDDLLAALERLPLFDAAVAILVAEATKKRAKEMKLDQKMIYTAQSSNAPRTTLRDEAHGEQREIIITQNAPFLPGDVQAEWDAEKVRIEQRFAAMSQFEIFEEYVRYVADTLRFYAMGPDERIIGLHAVTDLTAYNSPDPSWTETTEENLEHQYLDDFWVREVRTEDHGGDWVNWNGEGQAPFSIHVLFRPRLKWPQKRLIVTQTKDIEVVNRSDTGMIDFRMRDEDGHLTVASVHPGVAVELLASPWIAFYFGSNFMPDVWGPGATKMEAMVKAVHPEPLARMNRAVYPSPDNIDAAAYVMTKTENTETEDELWSIIARTTSDMGGRRVLLIWHFRDIERWMDAAHTLGAVYILGSETVPHDPDPIADERDTDHILYFDIPFSADDTKLFLRTEGSIYKLAEEGDWP